MQLCFESLTNTEPFLKIILQPLKHIGLAQDLFLQVFQFLGNYLMLHDALCLSKQGMAKDFETYYIRHAKFKVLKKLLFPTKCILSTLADV